MEKLKTVSIGIAAYNEENNIKNLLTSILNQEEKGFNIKEIIVISDASTDKTIDRIREIKDRRIILIDEKIRKGQNKLYNLILRKVKSDFAVFLEADTILENNNYLVELLKPFKKNKNIGLTYGSSHPVRVHKNIFFERMLTFIELNKEMMYKELGKNSLYYCGSGKAINVNKFSNFTWPMNVPEDTYIYLYSQVNKIKSVYTPNAIIVYKSPSNFKDYAKKTIRFNLGKKQISHYFSTVILENSYRIPRNWSIKFLIKNFLASPTFTISYITFNLLTKIFLQFTKDFNPLWESSISTKILKQENG